MADISYGTIENSEPKQAQNGENNVRSSRSYVAIFAAIFIVVGSFAAVLNSNYSGILQRNVSPTRFSKTKSTSTSRDWTLYRKGYSPLSYFTSEKSSFLKYSFLDSYDALIEPYSETMFYVDGYPFELEEVHYAVTLCPNTDSNSHAPCLHGTLHHDGSSLSMVVQCSAYDEYTVTATELYDKDDTETGVVLEGNAVCMYVRREIRSLIESDLNATMDAMATMWKTTEGDGVARYGDKFHNSTYFTSAHYFGASQVDADHIHEGVAFLLQHNKLSNMFEISMQSVDPSTSLPYWDFTIDSAAGTSIFDNFIYQPNTFGTLTPPTDPVWGWTYRNNSINDALIPDGRWAYMTSEANIWYPTLTTGYGYLRAPWNMNPSPYLTRFATENSFPSCSSYYNWLKKSSLMMFLKYAPGPPHARTHGNVGGVFGCDKMDFLREQGLLSSDQKQKSFCSQWGFKMKDLYRKNYLFADDNCRAAEEPLAIEESTCGFHCVRSRLDGMLDTMKDIMGSYFDDDMSDENWETIRDHICTGDGYKVFYGDHLESASAADPSFWPIHPTQERAMHAKLMAGGFTNTVWYTDYINEYICGKSECYIEKYGEEVDYNPECCFGHYENDGFPDFVSGNTTNTIDMTNREFLQATDPTTKHYAVPYIYDQFDWSHCSSKDGDDIDGLLEDLNKGEVVFSEDDGIGFSTDDTAIFNYFFQGDKN